MAGRRNNKTGRSESNERFVALPYTLIKSQAYRALSPIARAVLVAVAAGYNGRNNGSIRFAVREGENWGLSKSRTSVGLRELTDLGFIRVAQAGAFTTKRVAAEYTLTWRSPEAGGAATRDYLNASPAKASPAEGTARPAGGTVTLLEARRCAA